MDAERTLTRDMSILEEIERDPDTTQADMATSLGVAVGTINWHLKRLVAKGYVKVKRAERRKLRYIITPEGIRLRATLTLAYIESSMSLYRKSRERAAVLIRAAQKKGYRQVWIDGDGEIAEVCRLTCMEYGLEVLPLPSGDRTAVLEIRGREIYLRGEEIPGMAEPRRVEPVKSTLAG